MELIKPMLLMTLGLLSACGGGSSKPVVNEPTTLTGVFIDSAVEGLHYQTPTHSGTTSIDGEFEYINGESVTFSIGGIILGSATGATQITPFDLFGLTPPSTELELRAELKSGEVSDFSRVANIARLLVSLDNDNNPDNGIDLTGWDTALANASLSFDANLFNFVYAEFDVFAKAHGVRRSVSIMQPLIHLYSSLGIIIPVNALSLTSLDNGDGVVDVSNLTEYSHTMLNDGF